MGMSALGEEFYPNKEQNDRANDGHDEAGGVKRRTWLRFGKQTADQSPDDRATYPEECGHYETEMLRARHDGACDQTHDETDDDVPDYVQHIFLLVNPFILTLRSSPKRFRSERFDVF